MFIHSARRLPVYLSSRNNRLLHTTCRTMDVITLSDESAVKHFKSKNSKSILYFTASWCPPCKVIKPIYEEVSKEFPEIAFGKVDVDDNSDSATEFNVSFHSHLVFFYPVYQLEA